MIERLAAELERFAVEREWAQFHAPKNVAMALVVEAAELLEIFQWLTPTQSSDLTPKQRQRAGEEMADVLNYLVRLASILDIDLETVAFEKIAARFTLGE